MVQQAAGAAVHDGLQGQWVSLAAQDLQPFQDPSAWYVVDGDMLVDSTALTTQYALQVVANGCMCTKV